MLGEGVRCSERPRMSYTPVPMKSVSTLFSLLAHSRRAMGAPMRRA